MKSKSLARLAWMVGVGVGLTSGLEFSVVELFTETGKSWRTPTSETSKEPRDRESPSSPSLSSSSSSSSSSTASVCFLVFFGFAFLTFLGLSSRWPFGARARTA